MRTKRIVIAGGSGFLGQRLSHHFMHIGWDVTVLTRRPGRSVQAVREVPWDGKSPGAWTRELEGASALINLAGYSVNCRYHQRNRRRLVDSRVHSTRALGEAVARCANPPPVWLNSSTATFYRHTFGPAWDEAGELGATPAAKDEFSIEIARAWEHEFFRRIRPDVRQVAMRSAMVLGRGANSVFPVLRRLVSVGLGGRMAGGKQFVSWIHETDFARAVEWLIDHEEFSGVVNLAAPNPVTNEEMMRTLRKVCRVPFGLPAPLWALEVGAFFLRTETELIIKSRRVISSRLPAGGFEFRFAEIEDAFRNLLASADNQPAERQMSCLVIPARARGDSTARRSSSAPPTADTTRAER